MQQVVASLFTNPLASLSAVTVCRNRTAILTGVELDEVCDFASLQVNSDCVIGLDQGIRIADGAGIMGHQVRDSLSANEDFLHLAQLVLETQRGERGFLSQKQDLYNMALKR